VSTDTESTKDGDGEQKVGTEPSSSSAKADDTTNSPLQHMRAPIDKRRVAAAEQAAAKRAKFNINPLVGTQNSRLLSFAADVADGDDDNDGD
jgi:hypothetical protein